MKNFITLFLSALFLISCEVEPIDSGLSTNNNAGTGGGNVSSSIVGDWEYTSYLTTTSTTVNVMGNDVTTTAGTEFINGNCILSFDDMGNYTAIGDQTFEVFLNGASQSTQTITLNDSGTYTITNNMLEFTPSSPVSTSGLPQLYDSGLTIDLLNSTTLDLSTETTTTTTVSGTTQTINVVLDASFNRL